MNNQKEKIFRAGVVPYYLDEDSTVRMLFMKPTITDKPYMVDKDKFQIAKGRIDDSDESTKTAALREAKEELGLWEGNVVQLYELGTFLGRTTIYAAQVDDVSMFSTPDACETAETKWMTTQDFSEFGRELHRSVVASIDHIIRVKHGLKEETDEAPSPDDDEFENPLAFDKWGRKVNYDFRRRRK